MNKPIYFDNAATTLQKPQEVIDAVVNAMNTLGNSGRGFHEATMSASRIIFDTREKLCALFGAWDPSNIAFTSNATESLNIAIKGLLGEGDHVITTAAEHNSVLRPIFNLADNAGIEVTVVPCDECGNYSIYGDSNSIQSAIRPNTRAIITCHGSNLTGNLYDIKSIGELAHDNNILFIVDAAQTAGAIPIDMKEMNIDVLCFTGHKALLGPQGVGGIIVNPKISIRPLKQGGSGVKTFERLHPSEMPTTLEAGTLNGHGIAGLGAALAYINETGIDKICEKEQALLRYLYKRLIGLPGIRIYGDFEGKIRCPIISFNVDGYDSSAIGDILASEYNIATRTGGHCAPLMHEALGTKEKGAVRVSLSHYNTFEEIDILIDALKILINN